MKNKNFLKKIAAGILGFVMTLGVGAAGYAASASEVRAASETFNVWKPNSSGANTLTWELDSCTITAEKNGGTNVNNYLKTNELRLYNKNIIRITPNDGYTITSVQFPKSLGTPTSSTNCTVSGTTMTATDGSSAFYTQLAATIKFTTSSGTVTYTKSASGPSYTVKFAANGGSGTIDDVKTEISKSFKIPDSTGLTPPDSKVFDYWSGSDGVSYKPNDEIDANHFSENYVLTLTANWKDIPGEPKDLVKLTISDVSGSISDAKFTYSGDTTDGIGGKKGGTGSSPSWSVSVVVPAGASQLVLYTTGWASGLTTVSIDSSYTTTSEITLEYDSGMTGNSPFTLSGVAQYVDQYRVEFDLVNIISSTTLTISYTDRGGIWYAGYKLGNVKTLKSIEITTQPTITSYAAGTSFNTSGMVVQAKYENTQGEQYTYENISGYTYSPNGKLSATDNIITVSYDENGVTCTDTVDIDVYAISGIRIDNDSAQKTSYRAGQPFDISGIKVSKVYSHSSGTDDTYVTMTPTEISSLTYKIGSTSIEAGDSVTKGNSQTVNVYYSEGGVEYNTSYSIDVDYSYVTNIVPAVGTDTLGVGNYATYAATVSPETANPNYTVSAEGTEGVLFSFATSGEDKGKLEILEGTEAGSVTITFTSQDVNKDNEKVSSTTVVTVTKAAIPQLTGFYADGTPTKATQYRNASFNLNLEGITIYATYDITDPEVVRNTEFTWDTTGTHPVGTYQSDSSKTVTVESITLADDYISSISFKENTDMSKKVYWVGDEWNFSGLEIVGSYASEKTLTVDASKVSFTTTSTTDVASENASIIVTAHYEGYTGTEPTLKVEGIQIKEVEMLSLNVTYTGGQPVLGTDFAFAGSITANMSNSETPVEVSLDDVEIDSVDKFTLNQQTITVTHKTTHATGTFNVQYKAFEPEPGSDYYSKVTSLSVGDTVTLYAPYVTQVLTSISTTSTIYGIGGEATLSNSKLVFGDGISALDMIVCNGYQNDTYSFKIGDNYLRWNSGNSLDKAATSVAESSSWKVNFDSSTGHASIACCKQDSNADRVILWNYANPRFACYKGQTPKDDTSGYGFVDIYKKSKDSGTPATVIKLNAEIIKDDQGVTKTFNEGDSISVNDFVCTTLYNDGNTKPVTATSVSPTKLEEGDNTITVNYGNDWSTTVVVNAAEIAHLDHIEVVTDTGTREFTRGTEFSSTGLKVKAFYSNTDKTKFPDHEVTGFKVTPLTSAQMNVATTYDVPVSYTENGVTKDTTYKVTVKPKVSSSVTIAGEGIEGSNGAYTLASSITNEVALTLECDGDETIEFVQGEQNVVTFANGKLFVNSQTKTGEQIVVSFKAGSAIATLTVNISAAEGITLNSDEYVEGFIGDELAVNISLRNVESATWTLPSGFTVEETSKDNTGFVGTISSSVECEDAPAVFSVLTGKGETLSVTVYVTANYDSISSISAAFKSGVSYTAGVNQEFSKEDLVVSYIRDSGAKGTLENNEFTVEGAPEGKLELVKSYNLTVRSTENKSATSAITLNVGMPSGQNVVTNTVVHHEGSSTTSWSLLSNKSQLDANEKIYLYQSSKGYVTGVNGSDATVSTTASNRIEFSIDIVNATNGTFKLKSTSGSTNGKYISNIADNKFNIAASQNEGAVFQISSDTKGLIYYTDSKSATRMLAVNGSYLRCYKTGNSSYSYFSAYISKTESSEAWDENVYTNNDMTSSLFNFIKENYNKESGFKVSWSALETEYNKLGDTEKTLLEKGVLSGTISGVDTQSCELFRDFISAYDAEVARLGSTSNFMKRPLADTGSITINYNDDTTTSETFNYPVGNYKLPAAPTRAGYVFKGWSVDGSTELKQPNDTVAITKGGSVVITAEWDIAISLTNSAEFKFTGLDMIRFQYVFEGTCPKDAQSGFLVSTSGDADLLLSLTDEQIKAGNNAGVTEVNKADNKLVIGTGDGSKKVSVMFYYIDEDGNVEKTGVITMSFDSFVTADGFDPSIYGDPYAIMALQYYIANLLAE